MIILIVLLSFAAVLQQPTSKAHAVGIGPAERKQIVDKHNALRRGVQPSASNMLKMGWSSAAEANAKRWANNCEFAHSPNDKRFADGVLCGENLFASTDPIPWNNLIQVWYNEVKDFKYNVGVIRKGAPIGHFTQMVWYKSYLIGCYDAHCPQSRWKYLYVCQYCPAGNMKGSLKTPYKAGPPCADCPGSCDNGLCTNPCKEKNRYSNCASLKDQVGCKHYVMKDCQASCKCPTEII